MNFLTMIFDYIAKALILNFKNRIYLFNFPDDTDN